MRRPIGQVSHITGIVATTDIAFAFGCAENGLNPAEPSRKVARQTKSPLRERRFKIHRFMHHIERPYRRTTGDDPKAQTRERRMIRRAIELKSRCFERNVVNNARIRLAAFAANLVVDARRLVAFPRFTFFGIRFS